MNHFYEAIHHPKSISSSVGLNAQFFKQSLQILKIIFKGENSVLSIYILLILTSIVYQITAYYLGVSTSKFYTVLTAKNSLGFQNLVVELSSLILVIAIAKSVINTLSGYFSLRARRSLVGFIHSEYVQTKRLYYCIYQDVQLDNPDQRITQDVDKLTQSMAYILQQTVISPFLVIYYVYQTTLVGGWIAPFILFGYFITSCIVTRLIIQPISRLVFTKEQKEGDFRHLHVRMELNAESIAILKGETKEKNLLNSAFEHVLSYQKKIVNWQLLLGFLTNFIDYFGSVVCYSVIGIPILSGKYNDLNAGEIGELISKNLFVSLYLLNIFTTIVDLGDRFADLTGYVARIGQFLSSFDVYFAFHFTSMDTDSVKVNNLSFGCHPSSRVPIISSLSFTVSPHTHLIIQGASGCGKSTLIKVLADLYPPLSGTIHIPSDVLFLPQNPYMICGKSLQEQVCYPDEPNQEFELQFQQILIDAEIQHLSRYIVNQEQGNPHGETSVLSQDWTSHLSAGERQRIAFARLLYKCPKFAILDEATIHMNRELEARLFTKAIQKGITFIIVSHYPIPSVVPSQVLDLQEFST